LQKRPDLSGAKTEQKMIAAELASGEEKSFSHAFPALARKTRTAGQAWSLATVCRIVTSAHHLAQ
jgi:hypothetical protein